MTHGSTSEVVKDLEKIGQLVRIKDEFDPNLNMAELVRRVYAAGGPALLFENVKGSPFPAAANLYGTIQRTRYIFRHTLECTKTAVAFKAEPKSMFQSLLAPFRLLRAALTSLPLPFTWNKPPVLARETSLSALPQIRSWPEDGGAFITLPQVFSMDPESSSLFQSNIGMYRVQLSGNAYTKDREVGLHYQIHRGIGIHHEKAMRAGKPLKVSIFVGGPPANTFAAVMPLPEGLSETVFAGMLAGRNMRFTTYKGYKIAADADFCIIGTVHPSATKPEGPFGDHLGYYSLTHEFPFLEVEKVFHREDAVWPFTVVGRPPQEDTSFGAMIHEITSPMVPVSIPGVKELHAVDEAGVHPLLLAVGSERYVPYGERRPMELLTQASAVLGFGQCSLAKYLLMATDQDDPGLKASNTEEFFRHVLERVRLEEDLHFHTKTTIDTLDYSSEELNFGSKLVITVAGEKKRNLSSELGQPIPYPSSFAASGILMVEFPPHEEDRDTEKKKIRDFAAGLCPEKWSEVPLMVLVDDHGFASKNFSNFLWTTFTRSNPASDIFAVRETITDKHWEAYGSLIIDARKKPHHAPPLMEDETASKAVDNYLKSNPETARRLGLA